MRSGPSSPVAPILLVEDDASHAHILTRSLNTFLPNVPVTHLKDGAAALDYLFRRGAFADPEASPRPQLVLLDLRLPRVKGLEVLRTVQSSEHLRDVPIMVLTTSSMDTEMEAAFAAGAVHYMVKPFDLRELRETVLRILEGSASST